MPNIKTNIVKPQKHSENFLSTYQDFQLLNGLLSRPRYKIPRHLRETVMKCCEDVMGDEEASPVTKLAACRTILKADEINIKIAIAAMPQRVEHVDVNKASTEELINILRKAEALLP